MRSKCFNFQYKGFNYRFMNHSGIGPIIMNCSYFKAIYYKYWIIISHCYTCIFFFKFVNILSSFFSLKIQGHKSSHKWLWLWCCFQMLATSLWRDGFVQFYYSVWNFQAINFRLVRHFSQGHQKYSRSWDQSKRTRACVIIWYLQTPAKPAR